MRPCRSSRRIRLAIVVIQKYGRRFGRRLNYLWMRVSAIKIQRRFRAWRTYNTVVRAQRLRDKEILQHQIEAVNMIKINWRNAKFNRMVRAVGCVCACVCGCGCAPSALDPLWGGPDGL